MNEKGKNMAQTTYEPLKQAALYLKEMRAGHFHDESGEIVYPNALEEELKVCPLDRYAALDILETNEDELRAFDLLYLVRLAQNSFMRIGEALDREDMGEAYTAFLEVENFAESELFGMNAAQSLTLIGLKPHAYAIMKDTFASLRNGSGNTSG